MAPFAVCNCIRWPFRDPRGVAGARADPDAVRAVAPVRPVRAHQKLVPEAYNYSSGENPTYSSRHRTDAARGRRVRAASESGGSSSRRGARNIAVHTNRTAGHTRGEVSIERHMEEDQGSNNGLRQGTPKGVD